MSSLLGLSMAQEDKHSLEAKFAAAVKVMRSLPEEGPFQPSDDMMLMFYSYYKQATSGPCNIPRPSGFWDTHGKAKWDAWSSLGNMTKEEAMKNYIEDIQLILETIPISDEVSDLVQKLGNFYTEVDGEGEEAEENEVDRRPFTMPFAKHAVWSPDPRLLMAEDKRWRSDTRGSSSSMEPSVSSFTNGTHSSLNSEVEEEELACSIEPTVPHNPYMHFNGHLSDHSSAIPEKNHRSTDSDNEEFCDSMEHLAMDERVSASKVQSPGSGAASVKQNDLWFESNSTLSGGEDQVLTRDSYFKDGMSTSQHSSFLSRRGRGSPRAICDSQWHVGADAAGCCVSQSRRAVSVSRGNINEQIATALLRLQRDMASVLHRLHTLETLTVSQSRSSSPRQEDSLPVARKILRPSWWPFDFSPLTVVLTALWPLIAHWLAQLYLQRKRRKIP
ncbi:acyl-CoA-binding domain-containing protein 5-B isoform X1 [Lates calcarifer]|uniref:Acyl-CoA-binding domain-containing protein 5-B isoform X1 n=1 Tax=Lates calcarifer TaxID=8187 RepID=A0AAJ7LV42_LATCA|nr:acyl-CoA-binding domain-containing protein 5-B isoform X1 [Lates calcarifer]XP_050926097.1 acyl-CoA-binding domain-containing protein 5-B isoform X1 [Lates calcarifer]XP_050926098.1 acyl-CoA-binding domain-containing protein 5-B isoform X1 [Lates calcarifer]